MRKIWLAALFASAAFSEAYASEIVTEVAVPQIAGVVNEDAKLDALLNETAVSSVSKALVPLRDYFTGETQEIQIAGRDKLANWQDELYDCVQELGSMVRKMADDGVVASGEFFDLEQALRHYGDLRSYANQELAFYRLSIPKDEHVEAYWKLLLIEENYFSGDDRKESVRRFFFNLTGKDVRVKVEAMDKLGKALLMPLSFPLYVILNP